MRILVVDDEPSILFAMREYLEAIGFVVDCAATARDAMSLVAATGYDLVIADLRLSAELPLAGLDLLGWARRRNPALRTILLTAYGSTETEREARRLGVDAMLHKTRTLPEIAEVVRGLLA